MTLSGQLADFIRGTRYENLPDSVVESAKRCVLDWLGSALAGASQPPIRMIGELAEELGGAEQATLITGGKSSLLQAALVNGAASHVVELDDIHKSSIIHAATVVIPPALALAEWLRKSGRELITAVVVGYDVCFRIGEAVSPAHYYYWHNTATCGTFGAAAAAAWLLDLDVAEIVHALGNAGTQAAGLWEFLADGAMTKQLHTGKAAMNGLLASLLAQKGFTGPAKILEGERGFFRAMAQTFDESRIGDRLGEHYKIVENSFKIHASCRHTHPAVDLALQLKKERGIEPSRIRRIRVGGYRSVVDVTSNPNPQTVYASKFSTPFCVSLALVKGKAGLREFQEQTLWDPDIRALMERVEVTVDPQVDAAYPAQWGSTLEVETVQGERIRLQSRFPKGDPEHPVPTEELVEKFRSLATDWPAEQVKRWIDRILHLETLPHAGMLWE
jgi:2-methylcitrate dehydratase PrpD